MLLTKLYKPPVSAEHVYRDHLIDLLDKNLYKPLTLVSAGAGYGKSMLISSWIEKSNLAYAWLSLSDDDNDLRIFIDGLSTSIRKEFPKALGEINNYLEAATLPPLTVLSESLINGLDEIEKELVLVLDDYHLIQNIQINELINKLLHFPPQHMHLVIISRSDPFLNLSSLRARSRINEIRMAELCFDIVAEIESGSKSINGVILSQGGAFGGWSLYVKDDILTYVYNYVGIDIYTAKASAKLPKGKSTVKLDFAYEGGKELGKGGKATLFINGKSVGSGKIGATQFSVFSADESASVGVDNETPVSSDYNRKSSKFNGKIDKVTITLK